mmetsp:Transcript_15902/g.37696  ORF Transcript_15902/g.37696 Transcript_15902/m.37696 type:complete len:239 (-) Transcript_15902:226-942(-)
MPWTTSCPDGVDLHLPPDHLEGVDKALGSGAGEPAKQQRPGGPEPLLVHRAARGGVRPERPVLEEVVHPVEDRAGRRHADDRRQDPRVEAAGPLMLENPLDGRGDPSVGAPAGRQHPDAEDVQGEAEQSGRHPSEGPCKEAGRVPHPIRVAVLRGIGLDEPAQGVGVDVVGCEVDSLMGCRSQQVQPIAFPEPGYTFRLEYANSCLDSRSGGFSEEDVNLNSLKRCNNRPGHDSRHSS